MRINEFFDCKSRKHLEAYRNLNEKGVWPPGFYDEMKAAGVVFDGGWMYMLATHIADHYVKTALDAYEWANYVPHNFNVYEGELDSEVPCSTCGLKRHEIDALKAAGDRKGCDYRLTK